MKPFNPYDELGVPRDATPGEIKKAFRRQSFNAHPDLVHDTGEAFQRLKHASVVLLDPAKRKRYDETGEIDADNPDNLDSAALGLIIQIATTMIERYIAGQAHDPVSIDLKREMRQHLQANLNSLGAERAKTKAAVETYERVASRFSIAAGQERIGRSLKSQADILRRDKLNKIEAKAKQFERALEILETHKFDPLQKSFAYSTTSTTGTGTW